MLQGLKECLLLKNGWYGEDSLAPTVKTIEDADTFMGMLPSAIPKPTVSVDEDGEISLDWVYTKLKAVIISSFRGQGTYSYAVSINGKISAGSVEDPGLEKLPEDIIEAVEIMITGETGDE